jgi:hypothetical protein
MEKQLKKLPTGIQTFERIIREGCIYVDKTRMLVNLIERGSRYFLARPRRFGKSLTLTTLEAMFRGRKELFGGLFAEEWLNRPDFTPSPVIRLSMNAVTTNRGLIKMEDSIVLLLREEARKLNVKTAKIDTPGDLFQELIIRTAEKYDEKVVVLIDEYDKPCMDFIDDPETANNVRETLANFYVRIKANDEYIRFVLLTGISKFAKLGVFSKLNNLTDISLRDDCAALCGITHEELLQNFSDYIELAAEKTNLSKDEAVEKIRDFYNGFSFNGKVRLYNPYSTLRFFDDLTFSNYWFDAGTSTAIAKYLKNNILTAEQFRNLPVTEDFARNPGEMDSAPPEGFLYQGGFLTLREGVTSDFALDYPNREVLNSMSRLVANNFLIRRDNDFTQCSADMSRALWATDHEKIIAVLNRLLASIPYDDFKEKAENNIIDNQYAFSTGEWLYRATILSFFRGCGIAAVAEMHTNRGRADLVLNHRGRFFIIELKVAYAGENPAKKADRALKQIFEKNYCAPFPNAICIGMAIDDSKRQITEFRTPEMNDK